MTIPITAILKSALAYFLVGIAFGFAFGAFRVTVLVPVFDDVVAVLIEAPVMLAVSVRACNWAVRRFKPGDTVAARLAMGLVAFIVLQGAETLLAGLLGPSIFSRNALTYVTEWSSPARLIGLISQVIFALIPLYVPRRQGRD